MQETYQIKAIIHLDDGRQQSIPIAVSLDQVAQIEAKAHRESIPPHLLLAYFLWHCVAAKLGTAQGWAMAPVDGYTLPLPREAGAPTDLWRTFKRETAQPRQPDKHRGE